MAQKDVVLFVEEQQEAPAYQFGKPADGSDHVRTLADLKSKFKELENEKTFPLSSAAKTKCLKVPELPSDVEPPRDHHYEPKVMSLGPYHRGKPHLVRGETIKLELAAAFIRGIGESEEQLQGLSVRQPVDQLVDSIYNPISDRVNELRGCYDAESIKNYTDDGEFSVMMLVDGCALLYYILCVSLGVGREDFNIRYHDLSLIHLDVLLLENQLPYQLLHELMNRFTPPESVNDFWTVIFQEFFGMLDESCFQEFFGKKKSFLRKMKNYCCGDGDENSQKSEMGKETKPDEESKPCHLLDLFRKNLLGYERYYPESKFCHPLDLFRRTFLCTTSEAKNDKKRGTASFGDVKYQIMASFRNVKELMAAGIRIKRSPTRHFRDISFTSNCITACLRLPPITIDDSTETLFLNLIAYEMTLDIERHDFISYLRFLDSLVDTADDVKELQSAGILHNNLGTHEQVAEFFNTVSAKLESNFHAYKDVRVKIRKHLIRHYNSRLRMWMTECLDTYFGSPWTIIAWVGAALALFFTAVQTYFSVFHV